MSKVAARDRSIPFFFFSFLKRKESRPAAQVVQQPLFL
jgi:hypothetical protein